MRPIVIGGVLLSCALLPPCTALEHPVTVTVFGGALECSGSLTVLSWGGHSYVIDAGSVYPSASASPSEYRRTALRNSSVPPEAVYADAAVITHAHPDHIGRLPILVSQGFGGPILVTEPTAEIAEVMLSMQVRYDSVTVRDWVWSGRNRSENHETKLHWRPECQWRRKIAPHNLRTQTCALKEKPGGLSEARVCQTCSSCEVAAVTRLFLLYSYDLDLRIAPGIVVRFLEAGHIPGSASLLFRFEDADGVYRILFSGDLGNRLSALHDPPAPAPPVDAVFVECTYGADQRAHEPTAQDFRQAVAASISAGHIVWIPAFALDRTQTILHQLWLAQWEGRLTTGVPIVCSSPTGARITELYASAAAQHDGWLRDGISAEMFQPQGLTEELLGTLAGPAVLVTTSGMMDKVTSASLLSELLPRSDVDVFTVGYQDPGTPGWQIHEQSTVVFDGQRIPVNCGVHRYGCFSRHGDAADIDAWLASIPRSAQVVLVHGDEGKIQERRTDLARKGWLRVQAAEPGRPILLGAEE